MNATDAISSTENPEKGQLTILTHVADNPDSEEELEGATLVITFQDNGPGIPEALISDIFDPFFTTKEPGKGTGLGLSVSFMIIESFGGTIRAENTEGGGAVMTLLLPLAV
ncbi:MAG: ATP-binding protein [Deltaproteobacteria bacterium]